MSTNWASFVLYLSVACVSGVFGHSVARFVITRRRNREPVKDISRSLRVVVTLGVLTIFIGMIAGARFGKDMATLPIELDPLLAGIAAIFGWVMGARLAQRGHAGRKDHS